MPIEDITHVIIGSGNHNGFNIVGAIFQLKDKNFFKLENIHTIYATSAGSIVATLLLLSREMEDQTIVDYIVQRPWDKIIRIAPDTIINMFSEKGLLDKKFIHSIFSNIFACHPKGITTSVTLLEFYKITNTKLYIYATQASNMSSVIFSHCTHPDLPLLDAIYMSSSFPILFQPICSQGEYMIDGEIANPDPIGLCLDQNVSLAKILRIEVQRKNFKPAPKADANIFVYAFDLVDALRKKLKKKRNIKEKNLLIINIDGKANVASSNYFGAFRDGLTNSATRKNLIQHGRDAADLFLEDKS